MKFLNKQEHRNFKDEIYGELTSIGRALASPKRLEILDLLSQREWTVEDLAREMNIGVANTSQHLQILLRARLAEVRRVGTYAYYRLGDENVFKLWQVIRDLGEARLADIKAVVHRYLGERQELEALDAAKLLQRVKAGKVILLDVRPLEEYRAGHIPRALSVPVEKLERILEILPKDREIIAYCRGPYCVFADEAVAFLRERGLNAYRLRHGFPDWKSMGLPVEKGG